MEIDLSDVPEFQAYLNRDPEEDKDGIFRCGIMPWLHICQKADDCDPECEERIKLEKWLKNQPD